jgi:hypothetical protein
LSSKAYEAKHGDNARHILEGIAAVGIAMDDGWDMDLDVWNIYNMDMHVPCSRQCWQQNLKLFCYTDKILE